MICFGFAKSHKAHYSLDIHSIYSDVQGNALHAVVVAPVRPPRRSWDPGTPSPRLGGRGLSLSRRSLWWIGVSGERGIAPGRTTWRSGLGGRLRRRAEAAPGAVGATEGTGPPLVG